MIFFMFLFWILQTHLENGRRSKSMNKSSKDSSLTDTSCAEDTGDPKNTSTPKTISAWEKAKQLKAKKSTQKSENKEGKFYLR